MAPTGFWWAVYAGLSAFVYVRPEYALFKSYAATVTALLVLVSVGRLIIHLTLYPRFLTPLKEIPTPTVSCGRHDM